MKLTQTSDFTLKYPWYDVFSTKTMVLALCFFLNVWFLNRFREYQFWEKYKGANLVLVKKNIKNEITEWNQCLNLFFDKLHCNRIRLNGDAWYTDGWSEEGCLQEGWSTECCIVEKDTVFADCWEKMWNFCIEKFCDF